MKIQGINYYNNLSFGSNRRKFDVQGHIGTMYDNGQKITYNSQNIIDTVAPNNVTKVLVSSLSGLNAQGVDTFCSETDAASEIKSMPNNSNVKLYPLLSCQPGITQDTSVAEQLLEENKFYGLKFHPSNTNQPIKDNFEIYSKYVSLAEKKGLPCVFHSVNDGKSNPTEIIKLAENHPKHPFVLYHINLAAQPEQMLKTIDDISNSINSGKSNLFVDISWLTNLWDNAEQNKNTIKYALEKLGADRILFGSDTPITEMGDKNNYGKFADFVENTVNEFYKDKPKEADTALNKIFYDNAEELFINKNWFKPATEKQSSKTKAILIGAGIAAVAIAAIALKCFNKGEKPVKDTPSHVNKNNTK